MWLFNGLINLNTLLLPLLFSLLVLPLSLQMPGISTNAIHADEVHNRVIDVVPPINVSTTYRYPENPDDITLAKDLKDDFDYTTTSPYYSRLSHPNSTRVETVLGELLEGSTVIYNSGLSAFFAAVTHFNPKTVAIGDGYHGCHGILHLLERNYGVKTVNLQQLDQLKPGDLIHVETPENPYAKVHDIAYYVAEAKKIGGVNVLVDATFAPPPLANPFDQGADMVMHSATKFFGGHSDLLAGCLVTKSQSVKLQLVKDRLFLGTNIGNMEAYLLLRAMRTYELRIKTQSQSATAIVKYLNDNISKWPKLAKIHHSSLQEDDFVAKQMKGGHSPVFSIELTDNKDAINLPSKLKYFQHATSLGGVESLIEYRAISDANAPLNLLRVSCGIENVEDLIADLDAALS